MNELLAAAAAFAAGAGMMAWHQRRLLRVLREERRESRSEREKLQARQERTAEDLVFEREQRAVLTAERDQVEAYDRGYLDGLRHGAEMGDVERMAYSLDQKQPGRVIRMARYREQGRVSG